MAALLSAAPLSATMVLPVVEWRGYWGMACWILHSIRVSALVEMFSRWHCNITARSCSVVVLFNTTGSIANLSNASLVTDSSISELIRCTTINYNHLMLNSTIVLIQ